MDQRALDAPSGVPNGIVIDSLRLVRTMRIYGKKNTKEVSPPGAYHDGGTRYVAARPCLGRQSFGDGTRR